MECLFGLVLFFRFGVDVVGGGGFLDGRPGGIGGCLHPEFQVGGEWFLVGFVGVRSSESEDDFSFDLFDGVIKTDTGFNPEVLEIGFAFPECFGIFGE